MKWTIHELIKKAKTDTEFALNLDLTRFITEKDEDLVEISATRVNGEYEYFEDEDLFVFNLHIQTTLTMLCSLTLKEVKVPLSFDSQLGFSMAYIDDDTHIIEGISIDLAPYVFSEILVEKPMKVYAPGALENYHEEIHEMDEEELISTSPFAKLKK